MRASSEWRRRSTTWSWGAAALALAMLALLVYPRLRGTEVPRSRESGDLHAGRRDPASAETADPAPKPRSPDAREDTPRSNVPVDERVRVETEKSAYAALPADDQTLSEAFKADPELYEEGPGPHAGRYGGRSGALPRSARPEDANVTTVLESEASSPKLAVWVPNFRNSAGTEVVINARLVNEDGSAPDVETISVTILEKATQTAEQHDLEKQADGTYAYRFRAPAPKQDVDAYDYAVYATLAEGSGPDAARVAQGAFQVHGPVARILENEAELQRQGGDLSLRLPVEIMAPGDYTFYAELWGGDEATTSVAFGMDKQDALEPGRRVATITFGGMVIRDREVDGPYTVRNVRVRRISQHPFAEADPVPVLTRTPPWPADSFH